MGCCFGGQAIKEEVAELSRQLASTGGGDAGTRDSTTTSGGRRGSIGRDDKPLNSHEGRYSHPSIQEEKLLGLIMIICV